MGIPTTGSRDVDASKQYLFEHRWTPKSGPTWPSGFSYSITWDSDANPNKCQQFFDEPNEGAPYSIGKVISCRFVYSVGNCTHLNCPRPKLAPKFLKGVGWPGGRGVGFPLCQFKDNPTPRPSTFCGIARGADHLGTPAYNAAWQKYLTALGTYLDNLGVINKTYYYTQNEPQTAADDALAAHLCRLSKAAYPKLRIAVSEEPKKSIAEDAGGACGYDIWIAHLSGIDSSLVYTKSRILKGEELWLYSLDHDSAPWWQPVLETTQGTHVRAITWSSWALRATGYGYYAASIWLQNGLMKIRGKLFRETFEDYEYMLIANGGRRPMPDVNERIDPAVLSVSTGISSWNKDPAAYHTMKREIGLLIDGVRSAVPTLTVMSSRPKENYYINFQKLDGDPKDNPLVVNGHTYLKVDWAAYSKAKGYGWSSQFMNDPGIALYGWAGTSATVNKLQASYLYDDYGRKCVFDFDVSPGKYNVSCSIGHPTKGYPGDPHNLIIEGNQVVKDLITTTAMPFMLASATVDITDGSVTIEIGGKSAKTNNFAYTFLQYCHIEVV